MTYNSKIVLEQGGSVLRIASGGSLAVDSGGTVNLGAGTLPIASGGSLTVATGGAVFLGNVQLLFAASNSPPGGLPVSASPGSIFFRSDGSMSRLYINTSSGTAGSVWTAACVNAG